MILTKKYFFICLAIITFAYSINAQADEICAEAGFTPSFDSPFAHVPYIYGKITLKDASPNTKLPNITVILMDSQQSASRITIGQKGFYCFKPRNSGGILLIEIDGVETARRTIPTNVSGQQREDFEIYANQSQKTASPGVISAKFLHPVNPKTVELYKKVIELETNKNFSEEIETLKKIVEIDPADFIAWAKLGLLYFEKKSLTEAEVAFKKSLELKIEYTPVWLNVGMIRVAKNQHLAAIEIFKHVLTLEPNFARAYQLLGESYLLTKQGTLGVEALNKAIKLDPIGMAECHLQLAHLYELAKANQLATKEYKMFLAKVPNHPNKKKFEEFIKKNPE